MAKISTHVLDTASGRPAEGMKVELYRLNGLDKFLLNAAITDADGRTGEPLFAGNQIETGIYELVFHAGEYFRKKHKFIAPLLFLEEIVVRFGVSEPRENYHVPLLLSPFAYSTYRGS